MVNGGAVQNVNPEWRHCDTVVESSPQGPGSGCPTPSGSGGTPAANQRTELTSVIKAVLSLSLDWVRISMLIALK